MKFRAGCSRAKLRRLAKTAYERSGHRCEMCDADLEGKHYDIHHVIPYAVAPALVLDPDNVQCLCPECHKAVHAYELQSRIAQGVRMREERNRIFANINN